MGDLRTPPCTCTCRPNMVHVDQKYPKLPLDLRVHVPLPVRHE